MLYKDSVRAENSMVLVDVAVVVVRSKETYAGERIIIVWDIVGDRRVSYQD